MTLPITEELAAAIKERRAILFVGADRTHG